MKKIVFVCTGNTCRSPMAEALFMDIVKEKGIQDEFGVRSRGVYAFSGDPASYRAIEVMKNQFGIDLKKHRAAFLDGPDIDGAYLILTMTLRHKNMILDIYPNAADKVFTLKEYVLLDENEEDEHGNKAYEDMDVIDPFGGDYEIYKDCALEIEELLFEVIDRI